MKQNIIVVTGKVQGVFFRANTRTQAKQLGLRGWVKNEPDGSVRIVAEGKPSALLQLVEWCWQGPPQAQVDDVTVSSGSVEDYVSFEIRR